MEWDDLRFFLAAARAGSLAGAARALAIEHSTVARRLAKLEHALGAAVVLRNPDGLQLTPLGRRLVPLAEAAERAILAVVAQATTEHARVRLAVPSGLSELLTPGIARMRARMPEIALEIASGALPVDLKRGEADLALRAGPVTDEDLIVKKVGELAFALYAARAYLAHHAAIDPDDLGGHEIVAFDPALGRSPAARWLEARTGAATVVLRSREMTDMLGAIASGLGIGVLPCFMADGHPALVRASEPIATVKLSLVYRREATLALPVRATVELVTTSLRSQAARLLGRAARR
jgi:DNA-binding transcriptional LysR family regulator